MQPSLDEVKTRYLAIQGLEAARCFEENVVTEPADADVGALLVHGNGVGGERRTVSTLAGGSPCPARSFPATSCSSKVASTSN